MLSFNLLTSSLIVLIASTLASPTLLTTRQATELSPFYLLTHVVSGDATKDNLFAVAYHAYAGGNDVALLPNSTETAASKGFLNGTYVQFDLGQGDEYPWGLDLNNLDGESYWDEWNAVGINTNYGDESNNGVSTGFFFNGTGLQSNETDIFGGWLACDWARGVPQLFWYASYTDTGSIPSSCAVVDLTRIPA